MTITSITDAESRLADTVRGLPAFKRSMPRDRVADEVDRELAAKNVMATHAANDSLRKCLNEVCDEKGCDEFEAIVGVLEAVTE